MAESRRAARDAAQNAAARDPETTRAGRRARTPQRERSPRRALKITLIVVVVLILLAGIWLAFRALTVKSDLEAAQQVLTSAGEGGDMSATVVTVGEKAGSAAAAAADPIWRLAEFIPVAGDNLRAVRLSAEALAVVANDIGAPVLALQADGQGEILTRALPILEANSARLSAVTGELRAAAESDALIGQVRSGVDQIGGVLTAAEPVIAMLPTMVGSGGAKNYLLAFQNNAESLPLGGSAASQTLLEANEGKLAIKAQASSAKFGYRDLDLDIAEGAANLYGGTYGSRINMSTTRPDWPSGAEMIAAFWNRDIDDTRIDGVISVDPTALQRILLATGPVVVGDVTLDHTNAVKTLLSDVYQWWDAYSPTGAAASDAFFASTAAQVMNKLASGQFNLKDMAWALSTSVEQGSVMVWMADEGIQERLESAGRIAGVLPTDNDEATTLGVYFRDVSASKIDFYMDTAVSAAMSCQGDTTTLTTSTSLTLDLSQDAADALPAYVKSFRNGSSFFSTQVFLYAPPGMTIESVAVEGRDVRAFREGNVDLGREVAPFQMTLRPGETASVDATFTGTGEHGALDLWTTPMVRPTTVTVDDTCQ